MVVSRRVALILAGGEGTRFRRLGHLIPKCLVPIYDQPMLVRILDQCASAGCDEALVSVGQKYERQLALVLERYTHPSSMRVTPVVETTALGAVRGMLSFASRIGERPSLVFLGDCYVEDSAPFSHLANHTPDAEVAIGVVEVPRGEHIDCNVVLDDGDRVVRLADKASPDAIVGRLGWCGVTVLAGGVLSRCASHRRLDEVVHLGDLLQLMVDMGLSAAPLRFGGRFLNINTPDQALLASMLEAKLAWRRTASQRVDLLAESVETFVAACLRT